MINKRVVIFFFLLLQGLCQYTLFSCTMILAGRSATVDGSVLLAHNNDLPGDIASLLKIVPGRKHGPNETIVFKNGLTIPQAGETYRMLVMQCYYGFAEGDAKAVNQFKVAIAGGTSLKDDRNDKARRLDPLIKGGVSGYIRYIALQRSKTARECVELIGRMYSKYGISYPSGVGVADEKEVWYIEAGGGKCWAAQRVPDDSYLVAVNDYRIGEIDFNDKENFILPDYLKSYIIKKGLWKPGKNSFSFAEIFGGKKKTDKKQPYYNARRVWRAQTLLTPSKKQDSRQFVFPFTLQPDHKLSLPELIRVLRDYYRDTEFFSQPGNRKIERRIATFTTVHTSVIQLRPGLPADVGAVIWGGVSMSLTTPYIPFYFGIREIPAPFADATKEPDKTVAFWKFNRLKKSLIKDFPSSVKKMVKGWQELEKLYYSRQADVIDQYKWKLKQGINAARSFLTQTNAAYVHKALRYLMFF